MRVARLWTIVVKEGEDKKFAKALEEISVPFLKTRIGKGFLGMYLLRNRVISNEITYITLWQSNHSLEKNLASKEWKDALKRFEARGFQIGEPRIIHSDIMTTLESG
ncbi:MAG: antibiotic biosynthesis monooxygenase [Thaumarchaeota archaeon]|nr:antibiotic biosynthesis monooxygenase [Nitrososphaerota archaeon]